MKSTSELGQNPLKHMAAGLEKTALIESCGLATPTPPMALETEPTPMRLSPLVAQTRDGTKKAMPNTRQTILGIALITHLLQLWFIASLIPCRINSGFQPALLRFDLEPALTSPSWHKMVKFITI
jgi:hypothetical protein